MSINHSARQMLLAILDDDAGVGDHIVRLMEEAGHHVRQFRTGQSMFRVLRREPFDLLLLNWTRSDENGLKVLRWVREHMNPCPPIIIVTARTNEEDIIAGLAAGADDYVTTPLRDDVLRARIDTILRRFRSNPSEQKIETFGPYDFDVRANNVRIAGVLVSTTILEFALALLLFRNLDRPLSRSHIVDTVWGSVDATSRTLDAHVSQIRAKLRLRPENGFRLSSIYGFGYRLERTDADAAPSSRYDVG